MVDQPQIEIAFGAARGMVQDVVLANERHCRAIDVVVPVGSRGVRADRFARHLFQNAPVQVDMAQ